MKRRLSSTRSVVLTVGPPIDRPWWWDEIRRDPELCSVDYVRINFRNKPGKQITTLELPFFLLRLLKQLLTLRKQYDYVFTVECDFAGLGIAFWQSLLFMRKPRHVILQFIMREKTRSLASRMKYALLKFLFRSVHRAICSSREEAEYYRTIFSWRPEKVRFVPILTGSNHVADTVPEVKGDYLLAAGRVFRDYHTAIQAVRGTTFKLIIVGGSGVTCQIEGDEQVEVLEEIPLSRFTELTKDCAAVVVPLEDRKISTGQTVLLQAMAMGKMVIATRTAGTTDYVEHMVNGLLVQPGNVDEMRAAMHAALDKGLRERLGQRARQAVIDHHLPQHYTAGVRAAIMT